MSDLIDRQQAIDALCEMNGKRDEDGYVMLYRCDACDRINALPTAEPQERKGKWIYCEDDVADCVDGYKCNKCGFFLPWDYKHKGIDFIKDYHFCPNCGCKMEVDNDS